MKRTSRLTLLAAVALLAACSERSAPFTSSEPTQRLAPDAVATGSAPVPLVADRDTTTGVEVSSSEPLRLYVRFPHDVEVRRLKLAGTAVRAELAGAEAMAASSPWAAAELAAPVSGREFVVTVTAEGPGARLAELELWGGGWARSTATPQTLAQLSREQDLRLENVRVVRGSPAEAALEAPGGAAQSCVRARLSVTAPRQVRRAFLVYEADVPAPVALRRSVDGEPPVGGFWVGAAPEARTLVDELDPERLTGQDEVLLCAPDDATARVTVSGIRLLLLTDDGLDVVDRDARRALGNAADGDPATSAALAGGSHEIGLDRPTSLDAATLGLASPARASVGAFDGSAWSRPAARDLSADTHPLEVAGGVAEQLELGLVAARADAPAALVSELALAGSGVGPRVALPRLVVTYPPLVTSGGRLVGERFGDRAFVQGWTESALGTATVEVGGASVAVDGAFAVPVERPAGTTGAWETTIRARFPDGTELTRTIAFDQDRAAELAAPAAASALLSDDRRFGRENQTAYGDLDPLTGGKVTLGSEVSLEVPEGAVARRTAVGISRKGPEVVPQLDAGMINVTAPAHGAYRFLPKGQRFAKAVRVTLPYDPALLPEGMTGADVRTYYYDEELGEWRALPRVEVQAGASRVVSATDHFTFMINAVLVLPDHPGPVSFNPNSIKDLKAADPSAGIDLVEAPEANAQGTAQLAFPLRLPKARGAYQPELRVAYDSGAAAGWLGVGWDVQASSVQIDTRYGVPSYTGNERYLLDGAQLVPTAEAHPCESGDAGAVFRPRVERDFRRILRCGAGPASYWWEVADKNGTLFVYGRSENAVLRSYREHPGRPIAAWNLERVVDANANLTEYAYDLDDESSLAVTPAGQPAVGHAEKFVQRYLSGVTWSGRAGARRGAGAYATAEVGPYHVALQSEQDALGRHVVRPDTLTSARLGFKVATRRRLAAVKVSLQSGGTQAIREYRLAYERGSFGKSRLAALEVYGAGSAPKLFYRHAMEYTDADTAAPFEAPVAWQFTESPDEVSLTQSDEWGFSTHGYVGFGWSFAKVSGTVGVRVGANFRFGSTNSSTLDVNGDGLPDRIVKRGSGYDVRFNGGGARQLTRALPAGDPGAGTVPAVPLPTLGADHGNGIDVGGQASFGAFSANLSHSWNWTYTTDFVTDADGDGLVDVVQPGGILLNQQRSAASPGFSFLPTVATVSAPAAPLPTDDAFQDAMAEKKKPADALVEWVAPYAGVVDVSGVFDLVARARPTPADPAWDGVRLQVYVAHDDTTATRLLETFKTAAEVSIPTPVTLPGVAVRGGSRLYFILSTLSDFAIDLDGQSPIEDARFAPTITYQKLGLCPSPFWCADVSAEERTRVEPTGARPFRFDAGEDFRLAGMPLGSVALPSSGTVEATTTFTKRRAADAIRACIQKFKADKGVSDKPCADASGDFELVEQRTYDAEAETTESWTKTFEVDVGESLVFRIESDLPVDAASADWDVAGRMTSVCAPDGTACRAPTADEAESASFFTDPYVKLHLPVHPSSDPGAEHSAAPFPSALVPTYMPYTGRLAIRTKQLVLPPLVREHVRTPVWITARSATRGVLFKRDYAAPSELLPEIEVTQGEAIYLEAHSEEQFQIFWTPTLTHYREVVVPNPIPGKPPITVTVSTGVTPRLNQHFDAVVDGDEFATVRSVFGGGYRGWRYGVWHGNNDEPFDPSRFKVSRSDFEDGTDQDRFDRVNQPGPMQSTAKLVEPLVPRRQGTYFSRTRPGLLPRVPAFVDRDGTTWVTATTMHGARGGGFVQGGPQPTTLDAAFNIGDTTRASRGESTSLGAGVSVGFFGANLSLSSGWSRQTSDVLDLNGDRIVDVVTGDGGDASIRLTGITDLASRGYTGRSAPLRRSEDVGINVGLGLSAPWKRQNDEGVVTGMHAIFPTAGGGVGVNLSATERELADVNGDGLPDAVRHDGSCFRVRLNLGTTFADGEDCVPVGQWSKQSLDLLLTNSTLAAKLPGGISDPDKVRRTTSLSVQTNAGATFFEDYGVSVNWESSIAATAVVLSDVTGDGLPDYVRKSSTDDRFYVRVNNGYGFGPEEQWAAPAWPSEVTKPWLPSAGIAGAVNEIVKLVAGKTPSVDAVEANGTYSALPTIGFVFSWAVPAGPFVPWIHFSVGGDATPKKVGGYELGMMDIDGDGFADHVLKAEKGDGTNQAIWARLNRMGKANLLKHVTRPLGGALELDYARAGNTVDMPESRWVLSKVIARSGRGGSGPEQIVTGEDLQTTYAYAGGKHDRYEREFYGFRTVTRTNPDGSRVVQTYANDSFATMGLLEREELWDREDKLFSATLNFRTTALETVTATPACAATTPFFLVADAFCRSYQPRLDRVEHRFYEGSGDPGKTPANPGITTAEEYDYDAYGNIRVFRDLGDASHDNADTSDDLIATVGYATSPEAVSAYWVSRPTSIVVADAAGRLLRSRAGVYDGHGNPVRLTSSVDAAATIDEIITWTADGTVASYQGPLVEGRRYGLSYGYDPIARTFPARVEDAHGYVASIQVDPRFGEDVVTTDVNGNSLRRVFDAFGRIQEVYDPNATTIPTLRLSYGIDAFPAFARTAHALPGGGTLDTVVIQDGLDRVVQGKQTAKVDAAVGWAVSGHLVFDAAGRVAQQGQAFFVPGNSPGFVGGTPRNPTLFTYDVLDRKVLELEPNKRVPGGYARTEISYGFGTPRGEQYRRFAASVTDAEGSRRVLYRDEDDRATAVEEDADGARATTRYAFDALGQLSTITDAAGNVTTLAYDMLGRRLRVDNRDTGFVEYRYDAAGNVVQKRTPNLLGSGGSIRYEYDYDHLTAIQYPSGETVRFEYGAPGAPENGTGRIVRVLDDAGEETRGYGRLGEVVRSTRTVKPLKPNGEPQTFAMRFQYDSFGRMLRIVYPDLEAVHYSYNEGGLLERAVGVRPATKHYAAATEVYLQSLTYDEFGHRKQMVLGNGATTSWEYDPETLRLSHALTYARGRKLQDVAYTYDRVGNVKGVENDLGPATGRRSGTVTYAFGYDRLYRLTSATGTALSRPGVVDRFSNGYSYDDIDNMLTNVQVHEVESTTELGTEIALPPKTNHAYDYEYDAARGPHRATRIGDTLLTYDGNGNTVRECRDHGDPSCTTNHDHLRVFSWDPENRLRSVVDGGGRHITRFTYDAEGDRVVKQGRGGDSIAIGQWFNLKGVVAATKHVFAGDVRVASKLLPPPGWGEGLTPLARATLAATALASTPTVINNDEGCDPSNYEPQKCPYVPAPDPVVGGGATTTKVRPETYYYHADHLGSTSWVTDQNGRVHEHVEYFPFGEVWRDPRSDSDGAPDKAQQFLFTSKELDPETGLYYFGARYYDPRHARWVSPDSLEETLERLETEPSRTFELALFTYAAQRPIVLRDPDGKNPGVAVATAPLLLAGPPGWIAWAGIVVTASAATALVVIATADYFSKPAQVETVTTATTATAEVAAKPAPAEARKTKPPPPPPPSGKKAEAKPQPKPGSAKGPGKGQKFGDKVRQQSQKESGNKCVFCGKKTTRSPGPRQSNTDHAIPKSRGGDNTIKNAQNTCRTCNLKKGPKTTKEFLKQKGKERAR